MVGIPQKTSDSEHFHHAPDQTELEKAVNRGLTAIEPYTNHIMITCLAVTVVLAGAILWYRNAGSQQAAGWDEFALCRAPDDYAALAEKYPKSSVGNWALLEAARGFVTEGLSQALVNKDVSQERLEKAKSAYQTLLNSKVPPELREEALYGMATCLEALSEGDTAPAIDAYETLLQEFPESQHRLWAEERINALKSKDAQAFYAWFHKQDPKPADRPQPKDILNSDAKSDGLMPELEAFGKDEGTGKGKSGTASPPVPPKVEMPKSTGEKAPEFPEGTKPTTKTPARSPAEKPVPPAPKADAAAKPESKAETSPASASDAPKAEPAAKPALAPEAKSTPASTPKAAPSPAGQ
jgi:hypothetical protein